MEEKKEVKNSQPKKNVKGKIIIISSIVLATLVCTLLVYFFIIRDKSSDTYKIAKQISKSFENVTLVKEDADKEDEYSYIESVLGYIDEVGSVEGENVAFAVSKYNSSDEASQKAKYFENMYTMLHEKIDGTLLEEVDDVKEIFDNEKNLIFTSGIYLISINKYYENRYDELKPKIIDILRKYNVNDAKESNIDEVSSYWQGKIDELGNQLDDLHTQMVDKFKELIVEYISEMESCKGKDCEEYLDGLAPYKKYTEVEDQLLLVQNKYDEIINKKKEIANNISSTIAEVEKSLNETDYEDVKKQIKELNDDFYNDYKTTWGNRLNAIDENVYKKSCKSYGYKDVLRNPEDYKDKKTYWFGVVQQKVSSSQYRVGVDCEKYNYISGYFCKNTIYVYYYGSTSIIEDDVLKMWGTMDGTVTYTAVLGNSITIPSFNAKYITIQ